MPQFSPDTVTIPYVETHEPCDRRLEDHRGLLIAYITKSEARALHDSKRATRINKRCLRFPAPFSLSASEPSPSTLTGGSSGWRGGMMEPGDGGDMHKVAGAAFSDGKIRPREKERLIGHGYVTA